MKNCIRIIIVLGMLLANGLLADDTPRIVVLGDSLTAGFGVETEENFVSLLQEKVRAAGYPHIIANAGVSGDTSAGGLRRVGWSLSQRTDILIIALGGNDGLRGLPPAALASNLEELIDRARELHPEVRILLAGMRMADSMGAEYAREFAAVYPAVAESREVALLPFLLEGVAGKAEMNLPDFIHPNPQGHERIADNVWPLLEELLTACRHLPQGQ